MRYTPSAIVQYPILKLHQYIYQHSGGRVGARAGLTGGVRTLLLTTTGQRTHKPRTSALIYLQDKDRFVVVASKGGSDHPPAWLLNLQAEPNVQVQVGRSQFSAKASVASPEERQRLWPLVNRNNRGLAPILHPGATGRYDVYQQHTKRSIPLVLLEPNTTETHSPTRETVGGPDQTGIPEPLRSVE